MPPDCHFVDVVGVVGVVGVVDVGFSLVSRLFRLLCCLCCLVWPVDGQTDRMAAKSSLGSLIERSPIS